MAIVLLAPNLPTQISPAQTSSALQRADNLDPIAGGERRRRPIGTPHHGAVDRDSKKPHRRVDPAVGEELGDCGDRNLFLDAVDLEAGHWAAIPVAARCRTRCAAK